MASIIKLQFRPLCNGELYSGKESKLDPAPTRGAMLRAIHLQTRHGSTADWCEAKDNRLYDIDAKMLLPSVTTWMEQSYLCLTCLVLPCFKVRLEQIAGVAGQGEIVEVIGTTAGVWEDMFHFKLKIKHGFRRVAVFAAIHCAFCNHRVQDVHG